MFQKSRLAAICIALSAILVFYASCKSCKKNNEAKTIVSDTSTVAPPRPLNTINLPHADTSLIPVLSHILDQVFDASAKKDYNQMAALVVYRGPDEKRFGNDVFNARNAYEKNVIRITADVFNKWNKDIDNRDYARVFEMDQPDGRKMEVMEVIFVSKKKIDRKFFGFLMIKDQYKLADITSYL
jgi:hypothetical protein